MKTTSKLEVTQETASHNIKSVPQHTDATVPAPDTAALASTEQLATPDRAAPPISTRALAKIMTSAKELGLSCVGVAGISESCGASEVAHGLAHAFSKFGQATLLVIASNNRNDAPSSTVEAVSEYLAVTTLNRQEIHNNRSAEKLCDILGRDASPYTRIVVDLPTLYLGKAQFDISLKEIGALCDATYLVCETAGHSRSTLANAVDFCRLSDVKIAGWVLNDHRLKFRSLISDQ